MAGIDEQTKKSIRKNEEAIDRAIARAKELEKIAGGKLSNKAISSIENNI